MRSHEDTGCVEGKAGSVVLPNPAVGGAVASRETQTPVPYIVSHEERMFLYSSATLLPRRRRVKIEDGDPSQKGCVANGQVT